MRGTLLLTLTLLVLTPAAVAQASPEPVAPPANQAAAPKPASATEAASPRALLERLNHSIQTGRPDTIAELFTEPFATRMLVALTAADRLGIEASRLQRATRARFGGAAAVGLALDGALEPYRPFSGKMTVEALDWDGGPTATAHTTTQAKGHAARPCTLQLRRTKDGWRIVPATGKALAQQLHHLERLGRVSQAAAQGFAELATDVEAGRVDSIETLTERRNAVDALALGQTARRKGQTAPVKSKGKEVEADATSKDATSKDATSKDAEPAAPSHGG